MSRDCEQHILFIVILINLLIMMIISTNQGNPNALKLIIAAKFIQKPVIVKIINPKGESINLFFIQLNNRVSFSYNQDIF